MEIYEIIVNDTRRVEKLIRKVKKRGQVLTLVIIVRAEPQVVGGISKNYNVKARKIE